MVGGKREGVDRDDGARGQDVGDWRGGIRWGYFGDAIRWRVRSCRREVRDRAVDCELSDSPGSFLGCFVVGDSDKQGNSGLLSSPAIGDVVCRGRDFR